MKKISLLLILWLWLLALLSPTSALAYVNPATGSPKVGVILRAFDKPEQNWLPGHRGVDLPMEIGEQVFSAETGTIAFVGLVAGTPTVSIDHSDGVRTTYQPVHSSRQAGEIVNEGEKIGTLGHPTTVFPGLQWGAKVKEEYINPISLLPTPTIRLKPLDS